MSRREGNRVLQESEAGCFVRRGMIGMLFTRRLVFKRYDEMIPCELCGMPRYEEEKMVAEGLNSRVCLEFGCAFCLEAAV